MGEGLHALEQMDFLNDTAFSYGGTLGRGFESFLLTVLRGF